MKNIEEYASEWLALTNEGNFQKAESLYFDKLLPLVSEKFKDTYQTKLKSDSVLISILGYSPEPLILTAKAMEPKRHIILATEHNRKVVEYLNDYLGDNFELLYFEENNFSSIYSKLKEVLFVNNLNGVVVDITGGKKSMVAAAAIFSKDYQCKIVYVDFDKYIPEIRKPKPGSEILNIVYDPALNQPEIFIPEEIV